MPLDCQWIAWGMPGHQIEASLRGEDRRVDLAENHWEKQLEWRVDVKSSVETSCRLWQNLLWQLLETANSKTFPNSSSSGHEWHNILAAHGMAPTTRRLAVFVRKHTHTPQIEYKHIDMI